MIILHHLLLAFVLLSGQGFLEEEQICHAEEENKFLLIGQPRLLTVD
jgi:hypothetical protein